MAISEIHPFRPLLPRSRTFAVISAISGGGNAGHLVKAGGHRWKIEGEPISNPRENYHRGLRRNQGYLLTQLRTCHNWLSTYAETCGFRDDDQCAVHKKQSLFLSYLMVDYSKELIGRIQQLSSLLGGLTEGFRGQSCVW